MQSGKCEKCIYILSIDIDSIINIDDEIKLRVNMDECIKDDENEID